MFRLADASTTSFSTDIIRRVRKFDKFTLKEHGLPIQCDSDLLNAPYSNLRRVQDVELEAYYLAEI